MKTNTSKHTLAVVLCVFAGATFAQAEPPVPVKTDGLPPQLKERIEQKAQEGQTSLIRYLNSTRHIHGLRVEDVVREQQPAAVAKSKTSEPAKVAEKAEAAK